MASPFASVGEMLKIKQIFNRLSIQLVWYMLKQLITTVTLKVVDIYRALKHNIHLNFGDKCLNGAFIYGDVTTA